MMSCNKQNDRQEAERAFYKNKQNELSKNDRVANNKYKKYMSIDPFPGIQPALLNSADIFRYVAKTGMIFPFNTDKLQGASYEVPIKGKVIWWDDDGTQKVAELNDPDDFFELKPDSIAFVTLEPTFRIPDYMALRFNLKISHVYKGLLLGTGPLVDPGFVGKLSIPLHNLTANSYFFKANQGMIQMEFTKLSPNDEFKTGNFQGYKRNWISSGRSLDDYIKKALSGSNNDSVRSSIPNEISKSLKEANDVKNEISDFRKKTEASIRHGKWLDVAIFAAVISALVFACTVVFQLGTANTVKKERIYDLEMKYEQLLKDYEDTINELNARIMELENQVTSTSVK